MDRVLNPMLAEMSTEDLSQRYSDSFVEYNGKPAFVAGFRRNGEDVLQISYSHDLRHGTHWEDFSYMGLNCARPASQWYDANGIPFFLSYLPKRQWKRGLCVRNTNIFRPPGFPGFTVNGTPYMTALGWKDHFNTLLTEESFKDVPAVLIPRPDRCLVRPEEEPVYWFYLRTQLIASVWLNEAKIQLFEKGFEEELFEVSRCPTLLNARVEYASAPLLTRGMFGNIIKIPPELLEPFPAGPDPDDDDDEEFDDHPPPPIWYHSGMADVVDFIQRNILSYSRREGVAIDQDVPRAVRTWGVASMNRHTWEQNTGVTMLNRDDRRDFLVPIYVAFNEHPPGNNLWLVGPLQPVFDLIPLSGAALPADRLVGGHGVFARPYLVGKYGDATDRFRIHGLIYFVNYQ